jgi:hypothetical protein
MISMGMTFDITVNTKQDGKPFHLLNDKEQEIYDQNVLNLKKEEIYMCGNWDVVNFLKEFSEVLIDDDEQAEIYVSIDTNNIETILEELKIKIKTILETSNIFNEELYGDGSDLFVFSKLYNILNNFRNNSGFNNSYLIGYAGW